MIPKAGDHIPDSIPFAYPTTQDTASQSPSQTALAVMQGQGNPDTPPPIPRFPSSSALIRQNTPPLVPGRREHKTPTLVQAPPPPQASPDEEDTSLYTNARTLAERTLRVYRDGNTATDEGDQKDSSSLLCPIPSNDTNHSHSTSTYSSSSSTSTTTSTRSSNQEDEENNNADNNAAAIVCGIVATLFCMCVCGIAKNCYDNRKTQQSFDTLHQLINVSTVKLGPKTKKIQKLANELLETIKNDYKNLKDKQCDCACAGTLGTISAGTLTYILNDPYVIRNHHTRDLVGVAGLTGVALAVVIGGSAISSIAIKYFQGRPNIIQKALELEQEINRAIKHQD